MRFITSLLLVTAMVAAAADAQHLIYLEGSTEGTPCKVLEETPEYVLVRIPSALVVRIESTESGSQEAKATTFDPSAPPLVLPEDSRGRQPLQAEIREVLHRELAAQKRLQSGSAVGRIFWKGNPLPGSRVKASRIGSASQTDLAQETLTDAEGVYRFEDLEPGQYKLSWVPLDGTHWIRRLRREPDFKVVSGETTEVEPLDAHAGTLN